MSTHQSWLSRLWSRLGLVTKQDLEHTIMKTTEAVEKLEKTAANQAEALEELTGELSKNTAEITALKTDIEKLTDQLANQELPEAISTRIDSILERSQGMADIIKQGTTPPPEGGGGQ